MRARARALRETIAIDLRFYALKANPNPAILRTLETEGFGFECVSLAEVEHVFATLPGIDPARVLFTPSFAPRTEYDTALAKGIHVTVDSVEALQRWPETFRDRAIWLRLDLGRGDGHHEKVRTGGSDAKFGLPVAKTQAFVAEAHKLGTKIVALHAHLGSGIDNASHWRDVFADLASLADQVGTVDIIDIGGGLPVPYTADARPFDMVAWRAGLDEIKAGYGRYRLAIEPGRYLVAEAGAVVLRATQVIEKDGIRRVGLDGGMNVLMRPAMYGAYHAVHNLSRIDDGVVAAFDVVGPICESSDVFGRARMLPSATAEGDVFLIADAGAYGMAMANTYNLRALPAEEIIDV